MTAEEWVQAHPLWRRFEPGTAVACGRWTMRGEGGELSGQVDNANDAARVQACVDEYCSRYGINPAPRLTSPYDLQRSWLSETIPNADKAGCYFIFDEAGGLLYIGKASLGSTIGRRVATYFFWDKAGDRLASRHEGWTRFPAVVRTIAVEQPYEAASLEEYLIMKLQPRDNTRK